MVDVKELKMLNRTDCQCGTHEFTLKDVKSVEQLQDAHGFYGNLVKQYSKVICPECKNETILLLKQVGQTWEIMNTAVEKKTDLAEQKANIEENAPCENQDADMHLTEQSKMENEPINNQTEEFICPECKKVCKSKIGLTAHMKTHQN